MRDNVTFKTRSRLSGATGNAVTYVGIVGSTLMLSGIFIFGAHSVNSRAPLQIAADRFFVASLIFLLLHLFRFIKAPAVTRPTLVQLCLAAFMGVFLYNIFFFNGLGLASASNGGLIIATIPIWTTLFERMFLRVRLSARKVCGSMLSFSGVALLFGFTLRPAEGPDVSDAFLGNVLYLLAAISFALYGIVMKKVVDTIDPRSATSYTVGIGAVMLIAWSALIQGEVPLDRATFSIPILYMALFGTVGAFLLWFRGIKHIGPARTSVFLNLVPIFTVLLASVFLDEALGVSVLVSLGIILVGVLIVQSDRQTVRPEVKV